MSHLEHCNGLVDIDLVWLIYLVGLSCNPFVKF